MKPKNLYAVLCLAGSVVPLIEFVPWVAQHGLDLRLMIEELFSTRIGAFFGLDVIVSAVVLIAFALVERTRVRLWWLSILATLCIGVSLGLPLFLFLRERSLHAE
jgi:uncharacterized protein DUF2834